MSYYTSRTAGFTISLGTEPCNKLYCPRDSWLATSVFCTQVLHFGENNKLRIIGANSKTNGKIIHQGLHRKYETQTQKDIAKDKAEISPKHYQHHSLSDSESHAVVWAIHIRESTGIRPPPAYLRHLLKQAQTVMPGQMKAESHLMTVHRNVTPEKCKSIPSPVQNTNKMAKHLHKKSKEFSKCKKLIAVFR